MEAPEKIYLGIGPIGGDKPNEKYLYAEWDEEPKPMVKNIEYTRTDAFIEKATKWLKENAVNFVSKDNKGEPYLYRIGLADEFIKAMML